MRSLLAHVLPCNCSQGISLELVYDGKEMSHRWVTVHEDRLGNTCNAFNGAQHLSMVAAH